MNYILKVENLEKSYHNHKVLSNLNMKIEEGAIYGLVGRNGAGKTTLIRIITGLQAPTKGNYEIFDINYKNSKIKKHLKTIGAIIEKPALIENMTARENIIEQSKIVGTIQTIDIDALLKLVGLNDTDNKKVRNFSLGMRQRLGIAITLCSNPKFIILDEPINGLDPTGIIELRNLLKRLNKERGITILISSHILTELHQLANRYGILHEGKLLQEITATELDKRCKKHLLLQVNDVAAASVLLESKLNTSNFSVMPDKSIHLYDYVENAGKVSALLSANNITIYQLAQSGDSLETYYTNLIGGCQND